jgi:hypothetical protein
MESSEYFQISKKKSIFSPLCNPEHKKIALKFYIPVRYIMDYVNFEKLINTTFVFLKDRCSEAKNTFRFHKQNMAAYIFHTCRSRYVLWRYLFHDFSKLINMTFENLKDKRITA